MVQKKQECQIFYLGQININPRIFTLDQFKTLKDFRHKLTNWFRVQIQDQNILVNNQPLTATDDTQFAQIGFKKESKIILLTKRLGDLYFEPRKQKKEKKPSPQQLLQFKKNYKPIISIKPQSHTPVQIDIPKLKRQICYLQSKTIDKLVEHFIKTNLIILKDYQLINNEACLLYLLKKMASGNIILEEILKSRISYIRYILLDIGQEDIQVKPFPKTVIEKQVLELVKLGYSRKQSVAALEIAQNNMDKALDYLYSRKYHLNDLDKVIQNQFQKMLLLDEQTDRQIIECQLQQFGLIFKWFNEMKSNKLIMMGLNGQKYLQIYINSMKHMFESKSKIFLKWQKYIVDKLLPSFYNRQIQYYINTR